MLRAPRLRELVWRTALVGGVVISLAREARDDDSMVEPVPEAVPT